MSTPTKQDDRHKITEVKPDQEEKEEAVQEVTEEGRSEEPWRSLWWWTTFELPKKPQQRADFIGLLLAILVAEWMIGPIIGMILRSLFGWPF